MRKQKLHAESAQVKGEKSDADDQKRRSNAEPAKVADDLVKGNVLEEKIKRQDRDDQSQRDFEQGTGFRTGGHQYR